MRWIRETGSEEWMKDRSLASSRKDSISCCVLLARDIIGSTMEILCDHYMLLAWSKAPSYKTHLLAIYAYPQKASLARM